MKMKCLTLAVLSILSSSASASITNIYDTDGNNRHTVQSRGPISSFATSSNNARELMVYVYRKNAYSSCSDGQVYESNSGQYITSVQIKPAGVTPVVDVISAPLPEESLNKNKVLKLTCTDEQGDEYNIRHNLPSVPQINWQATVDSVGDFINQSQSYSYHDKIQYRGNININNQTTDAYCYSDADRGQPLALFHDESGKGNFHSDVFVSNRTVENTAPVLFQSITCENPMGSTRVLKVWELTDENSINLITEETFIR